MKTKVGILGAAGYSAGELLKLLHNHGQVELCCLVSESSPGRAVAEAHPFLHGISRDHFQDLDLDALGACDVVFVCKPHKHAARHAKRLMDAGVRIIDLSADFRLNEANAADYEAWYDWKHECPELLDQFVYGLTEINREAIRKANYIANPGCYPTSVILGLAPLMDSGLITEDTLIIDSVSGVSGAGKKPSEALLYLNVAENLRPYRTGTHQHTPEIEQELSSLAGRDVRILFSPSVGSFKAGIKSSIYAKLRDGETTWETVKARYDAAYGTEPFIRIQDAGTLPEVGRVVGTNFCDIGFVVDPRTGYLVVFSCIDNIVKGASGQAVQNMNLICGYPETTGLPYAGALCG